MTVAILRRQINVKSSPIYRLPPESLAMAASYLNTDNLFTAVHVSYHWRATLLSFASLWSNIQCGNDEEQLAMLRWSKSAPLRVSLEWGCPPEGVMNLLFDNSARIISLNSDNRIVLMTLLARPMSSLRVLSIGLDESETRDLPDEPTKIVPFLRKLSVRGNIGGLGFCVPHLTHFKFHGWYSQETNGETLLSILGIFRRCPMLEVVDVGWGEELYNSEGLVDMREDVVSLPHLRYLAQEQYVRIDQSWLPDLLNIPQSCSVFLKKPPVAYIPEGVGQLAIPCIYTDSPYLSDIRRVKLRTMYDWYGDRIEIFMEIVNSQGILLSFQKSTLLGELEPRRDPWAIIDNEINPVNLCALGVINAGSPVVMCLDNYRLRLEEGESTLYVAQGLGDLGNVTTLILSNSTAEPWLAALEPDNREKIEWCSTVHSLVIYSPSQFDLTGSDILQSLLRVSKKRKIAGAPFRSVTLAIPSTDLVVSLGELAALGQYVEWFEFLTGDDVLDWDVDKYFIPNYDPLQRRRDKSAFDADLA